jgi:hypothetical protein
VTLDVGVYEEPALYEAPAPDASALHPLKVYPDFVNPLPLASVTLDPAFTVCESGVAPLPPLAL